MIITGFYTYTIITEYKKTGYINNDETEPININNLLLNSCLYDGMSSVVISDSVNITYKINNNLIKNELSGFEKNYKDINSTLKYIFEINRNK